MLPPQPMPPGMPPGPPGGTGPAMTPGPMLGAASGGLAEVRTALEMLQKALPTIPMGTDMHSSVLKAVSDISRHIDKGGPESQSATVQQLAALARQQTQQPPMAQAMERMFAPPPGGGAPAMEGAA